MDAATFFVSPITSQTVCFSQSQMVLCFFYALGRTHEGRGKGRVRSQTFEKGLQSVHK